MKATLVYRCKNCNLLYLPHQLSRMVDGKLFCPQDGGRVVNVTKTKRGQNFLAMYNRDPKEGKACP